VTDTDPLSFSSPAESTVNWGLLANVSKRMGLSHALSLRNMVTRDATEVFSVRDGYDPEVASASVSNDVRSYRVGYVERTFLQSQLSGRHQLGFLGDLDIDWNLGISLASRDEPENRVLNYYRLRNSTTYSVVSSENGSHQTGYLDDRYYTGEVNLSLPFRLWGESDQLLKVGVLGRLQRREYDAAFAQIVYSPENSSNPAADATAARLPPEMFTQPEYLGTLITFLTAGRGANPYDADNDVKAAYGMLDLPIFGWLRLVGGLRVERWTLNMLTPAQGLPPIARNNTDFLPSANLTISPSRVMNFRLAGYRTLSRPDPRELSWGCYDDPLEDFSRCGNNGLRRSVINSADARWEWYPSPGELISIGGFYKHFHEPIIEVVAKESFNILVYPSQAVSGEIFGGEVEIRKSLGFIADPLRNVMLGANFTYADGSTDFLVSELTLSNFPMQHLSRYLINGSIGYETEARDFAATVLYNYFDDRTITYGLIVNGVRLPDALEIGRGTVDAKLTKRWGRRITTSFSGQNLLDSVSQEAQVVEGGIPVPVGFATPGISASVSLGYAF
jgi:hypothetical protein